MNVCAVDFLPPDYRRSRTRRRVWAVRAGLGVLLVAAMATGSVALERRRSALGDQLAEVSQKHELARARIAQVEELDRQKENLARRLSVLNDVLARARGSLILEAVGRSCEESVRLTKVDVRVQSKGLEPTVDLTIEGLCAKDGDVARVLEQLQRQPLVSQARMIFSEDHGGGGAPLKKFGIAGGSPARLTEKLLLQREAGR